ncbi:MAG: hypothetical protein QOF40_3153, partial [Actinomycetota bacterium]|nr:hypothetical protein [Actinomycetota bacterium]
MRSRGATWRAPVGEDAEHRQERDEGGRS